MDATPSIPAAADTAATDADRQLMRRRLLVVIPIPAVFLGVALPFLVALRPDARPLFVASYGVELAACIACFIAMRRARLASTTLWVALAFGASFAAILAATSALIAVPAELLALTLVCELTGFAVLLPWSVRHQIALSGAAAASLALAGPFLPSAQGIELPLVGVVAGATSGVLATLFLDRSRREARRRAHLLEVESARTQEELEISSALLRVADTLAANVGRDEVFAMVNELAVASVGCQWSATLFVEEGNTFRLVAQSGMRPAVAEALAGVPLARGLWPMGRALSRGEVVAIDDADSQEAAPADVLHRLDIAAAIFAPIVLGGELVGMIANGNRDRGAPFTEKQRRLTIGLGQAVAVAVANHRSIASLHEANRLKSDFVSTMSHELRTPLNVITGYAEILCDAELGRLADEHAIAARGIARSAAELLELVTKTLDLSRLELGVDSLRIERVAPAQLFAEVEAELESLARPGHVRLSYGEEAALPIEVATDRGKLKTILKNLVGNALKFTSSGQVEVRAATEGDRLVLRVRDTGIGIAADDRAAVFEMFRQLAPAASGAPGGVGLGLYIVKRLVDLLGGSISLASEPAVGSEFTVVLPVRALGHEAAASPARQPPPRVATPAVATAAAAAPVRGAARSSLVRAQRSGYKRGA